VVRTDEVCPACGSRALERFFDLAAVPVLCNALAVDRRSALEAPTSTIALAFCGACTLVVNQAFDPQVIEYTVGYENSLHHSATFQIHAEEVAARLVQRHGVRRGTVLEIGPGRGDFLVLLSRLGENDAIGYEPSADPDRRSCELGARVRIVPEPFPLDRGHRADLVCARHVLEHMSEPVQLLEAMRAAIAEVDGVAYVEVPDGGYLLECTALWDVIYEHCMHLTAPALRAAAARAGLDVEDLGRSFGGQFLWAELRPMPEATVELPARHEVSAARRAAATFGRRAAELVERADELVTSASTRGPVVLWGVGSKGVTFLNLVRSAPLIEAVVDLNPLKHGRFVPVTGHEVVAPEALSALRPRTVVVLNDNYVDEVSDELERLGVRASVVTP
jgi:SAM-dependent methyltransferase